LAAIIDITAKHVKKSIKLYPLMIKYVMTVPYIAEAMFPKADAVPKLIPLALTGNS
jgi:hypothetical protein